MGDSSFGVPAGWPQIRVLNGLTSLRFFAALLVFGYHGNVLLGAASLQFTSVLFGAGAAGVDFFFILSGFLLAWSHRPQDRAHAFYRRRFARIYPTYLATLAIGFVLVAASDPSRLANGWATPFLLQAWLPDSANVLAINVPAWSLSVEAFFYLLFPLVINVLYRLRSSARYGLMLALFGLVVLCSVPSIASYVMEATGYHLTYFPPARLPEFVVGMLAGIEVKKRGFPRVPVWIPVILSVAAVLWGGWSGSPWGTVVVPLIPFLLLIVSVARSDASGEVSWLHRPSWVSLGAWSYAFYLVHVLALSIVHTSLEVVGLDTFADGWMTWVLTLGAAVMAAYLLHRFVESPLEKRLKGKHQRPSVIAEA